jgi:hypothetical protein
MTDAEKAKLKRFGLSGLDKPKKTPSHDQKSHVVATRVDGAVKIIRFGQQGADPKPPRKNESKADTAKRAAFKKRHAKNIAKGKSSPAYWSNKVKW